MLQLTVIRESQMVNTATGHQGLQCESNLCFVQIRIYYLLNHSMTVISTLECTPFGCLALCEFSLSISLFSFIFLHLASVGMLQQVYVTHLCVSSCCCCNDFVLSLMSKSITATVNILGCYVSLKQETEAVDCCSLEVFHASLQLTACFHRWSTCM